MRDVKRKIRAFCGFEQSGKDYSCKRLITTKGFKKVAFADALRDVAFRVIGMSHEEGMSNYEELKSTNIIGVLNFRNILENLGSGVRRYDKDFWARAVLTIIKECTDDICISDLRYENEYRLLKEYADDNEIDFKLIFCDYHSPNYRSDNPHESAKLAHYLKSLGFTDQQYVDDETMQAYKLLEGRI